MLAWLSRDGRRLLAARVVRSFAYGFIAVALGPYLKGLGYGGLEVGLVLTAALASAAASSVFVGFRGDVWGRRRVLEAMSLLMVAAGALLLAGAALLAMRLAGPLGTATPAGGEA